MPSTIRVIRLFILSAFIGVVLFLPSTTPALIAKFNPPDALAYLNDFQAKTNIPPLRDEYAVNNRLKGNGANLNPARTTTRPPYQQGEEDNFWVFDILRKNYLQVKARLQVVTAHVYWFVDKNYSVNSAALENAARLFEEKIYPTNRRYFGEEWTPGVDGDPHLAVLNTTLSGGVIGYYSSDDELLRTINSKSNEREIIYVMGHPENTDSYLSLLAHEFQHMIHWHNQPNQEVWLNEGASVLAQTLNGFSSSGYESAFFNRANTQLDNWTCITCAPTRFYGAGYLWMAYLKDVYGEKVIRDTITNGKGLIGFNALDYALAKNADPQITSDKVFKDWALTNYINRTTADPAFNYKKVSSRISAPTNIISKLPDSKSGNTFQYTAQYYKVESGAGGFTLNFQGASTASLFNTQPASGKMVWWTNRGENSDMTLTREVDLSSVKKAALKFKLWFDIEPQLDYLYFEVSEDGGKSWQVLPAKYTTVYEQSGKNYGAGWSGRSSGNGSDLTDSDSLTADWMQEEIDLSRFAGKRVQLRFEYLTDEGYNRQGAILDDFEIPEINWRDNAESGDNGWQANGFLRTGAAIPQKFWVRVMKLDGACAAKDTAALSTADNGSSCLQDMLLDSTNAGSLKVAYENALVMVAPYAPQTLVPAEFTLNFSR
ncbi:hypothetical protein [Candidatus Chlorohelix sp.]|uniref:hypothetical protein n=1 Tax=Candidatus Chlorohelix sp. TaxID=3139201 RepID=UPI00302217A7